MIKLNSLIYTLIILSLSSCASSTIPYSSEHENAWFLENRGGIVFPIYCMANKKEKAADPKCFEAKKLKITNE